MTVPPSGPIPCDIALVGEAPGREEVRAGMPFVGRAGKELWAILSRFGLSRRNVYVTNCLKERPPDNRDPLPEEMAIAVPALRQELSAVRPKLLVALGRFAAEAILGRSATMDRDHGLFHGTPLGLCLVSYHPAAALHSPEAYTDVWRDLQQIRAWQAGEAQAVYDPFPNTFYEAARRPSQATGATISSAQGVPYLPEGDRALESLRGPLRGIWGVDTEGEPGSPLGASYSQRPGQGAYVVGGPEDWPRTDVAVLHNAPYDLAMGIRAREVHDTLLMAHVLGETRVGLKTQAFRYAGMAMPSYEDTIRPAQEAATQAYLAEILSQYRPEYQERRSAKTGKRLKPKLLPAPPLYKAVARCLQAADVTKAWRGQAKAIRDEAEALAGPCPMVSLHDI